MIYRAEFIGEGYFEEYKGLDLTRVYSLDTYLNDSYNNRSLDIK